MTLTLDLPDAVVSLLGPSPERTVYQLIKAHLSPKVGGRPVVNAARDEEIAALAHAGATHSDIANSYGLSAIRVSQIIARNRVKLGVAGRPAKNAERDAEIVDKYVSGLTYVTLANMYKLSMVRIGQIVAQGKAAAYARRNEATNAKVRAIFEDM
jgi:Mor family transcriptional regulator